jgi:hypothetical protein
MVGVRRLVGIGRGRGDWTEKALYIEETPQREFLNGVARIVAQHDDGEFFSAGPRGLRFRQSFSRRNVRLWGVQVL